jgi:hypothetical protein
MSSIVTKIITNESTKEYIDGEDWRCSKVMKVVLKGTTIKNIRGMNEVRKMVYEEVKKKKTSPRKLPQSLTNCKRCLHQIVSLCKKYKIPITIYIKLNRKKQQRFNYSFIPDEIFQDDSNYEIDSSEDYDYDYDENITDDEYEEIINPENDENEENIVIEKKTLFSYVFSFTLRILYMFLLASLFIIMLSLGVVIFKDNSSIAIQEL